MTNTFIGAFICVFVLLISACANNAPVRQPNGVYLTGSAIAALDRAKADVDKARQQDALWTTALNELNAAETAATQGESAAVIDHAHEASALAKLGIAQLSLPSTNPFK
ncbi:MAG: hypothetical protein ACYC3O_01470 [Burkholderiales bacterium]